MAGYFPCPDMWDSEVDPTGLYFTSPCYNVVPLSCPSFVLVACCWGRLPYSELCTFLTVFLGCSRGFPVASNVAYMHMYIERKKEKEREREMRSCVRRYHTHTDRCRYRYTYRYRLQQGGARQMRNYQQQGARSHYKILQAARGKKQEGTKLLGASFLSVQKATLGTVSQQHGAKALRGKPRN